MTGINMRRSTHMEAREALSCADCGQIDEAGANARRHGMHCIVGGVVAACTCSLVTDITRTCYGADVPQRVYVMQVASVRGPHVHMSHAWCMHARNNKLCAYVSTIDLT